MEYYLNLALVIAFASGFFAAIGGVAIGALIAFRVASGRSPIKTMIGRKAVVPSMPEEDEQIVRFQRKL